MGVEVVYSPLKIYKQKETLPLQSVYLLLGSLALSFLPRGLVNRERDFTLAMYLLLQGFFLVSTTGRVRDGGASALGWGGGGGGKWVHWLQKCYLCRVV